MASVEEINQLEALLKQTIDHQGRKQAEDQLKQAEKVPTFIPTLLQYVSLDERDLQVRFAGSIYFKNVLRREWDQIEENNIISLESRALIRANIIDILLKSPKNIQIQLIESMNKIIETDYPAKWPELATIMATKLKTDDFDIIIPILTIFKNLTDRWRINYTVEALQAEILHTLNLLAEPFFDLFRLTIIKTANDALSETQLQSVLSCIELLLEIYLSSCYYDLYQLYSDNNTEIMSLLFIMLEYQNPKFCFEDSDLPGNLIKIHTTIISILDMYFFKHIDELVNFNTFMNKIFDMLVNTTNEPKYDIFMCAALKFLALVFKRRECAEEFCTAEILSTLCNKVIIPNGMLRESDIELFEDEPIEYIRRELEGSGIDSRRQSTSELIRVLLGVAETKIAHIFKAYSEEHLKIYNADPVKNWISKDTSLFLFSAIAIKTYTYGAVKVSEEVNLMGFFNEFVLPDLKSETNVNPILKVNAFKFVFHFRNHLDPNQILQLLPVINQHLQAPQYAVYTFAAICLERILLLKDGSGKLVFTEKLLGPLMEPLLTNLFNLTEREGAHNPTKVAENDFIMFAIMRVLFVGKDTLKQHKLLIAQKLSVLLQIVSKNPSNPKYNHYLFESIGAVVRNTHSTSAEFESTFWILFQTILTEDVTEFVPYVLQITSQILNYHPVNAPTPPLFVTIWNPLLHPTIWRSSGNIPALVKLLKAYILHVPTFVAQNANLKGLLGAFKILVNSNQHPELGLELLETLFTNIPTDDLKPFYVPVLQLVLMRLKAGKRPKYVYAFIQYLATLFCIDRPDFNPTTVVQLFEAVSPGATQKIIAEYIVPNLSSVKQVDVKVVVVGYLRFLTLASDYFQGGAKLDWPRLLDATIKLFDTGLVVSTTNLDLDNAYEADEVVFQASYVPLNSTTTKTPSIADRFGPLRTYVGTTMSKFVETNQSFYSEVANSIDPNTVQILEQCL